MNKFQKSLDRIKKNVPLHEDSWTDEDKEHILTVMEALEKQIPKKPVIRKSCKVNAFTLRCPNCEAVLQADSPCCRYCGQALDWSDTE